MEKEIGSIVQIRTNVQSSIPLATVNVEIQYPSDLMEWTNTFTANANVFDAVAPSIFGTGKLQVSASRNDTQAVDLSTGNWFCTLPFTCKKAGNVTLVFIATTALDKNGKSIPSEGLSNTDLKIIELSRVTFSFTILP